MTKRKVLFGPFIGEFGWELLFWQGWVLKECRENYQDFHKIACSFPGRKPFYPDVDEFIDIPEWYINLKPSCHAYYTDGWKNGLPGTLEKINDFSPRGIIRAFRLKQWPPTKKKELPFDGLNFHSEAEKLLSELTKEFNENDLVITPWKKNLKKDFGLDFGIFLENKEIPSYKKKYIYEIPFTHQTLEKIRPTSNGQNLFKKIHTNNQKIIAIFPRSRFFRRQDKNWSLDKYLKLIKILQNKFPNEKIAIFGEPGGAYFSDCVPENCIDLINIDPKNRMDIQIAALQNSLFALGSMSGAILVALASGTPSLTWGFLNEQLRYHRENFLGTKFIYHSDIDPSVETISEYVDLLIRMGK